MGNKQPAAVRSLANLSPKELPTSSELPEQFITQAHLDWKSQLTGLYANRPTVCRTVVLPPGVALNDARLSAGVVIKENRSVLVGSEVYEGWPKDRPFEADVDGRLLPPCRGKAGIHAHYAVYPDFCFSELSCGYCGLHSLAHPENPIAPHQRLGVHAGAPEGDFQVTHLTEEEREAAEGLVPLAEAPEPVEAEPAEAEEKAPPAAEEEEEKPEATAGPPSGEFKSVEAS